MFFFLLRRILNPNENSPVRKYANIAHSRLLREKPGTEKYIFPASFGEGET
jgi:hypothetical protein